MTPRQSQILAYIGLAIIISYIVYLGINYGFSKSSKEQSIQIIQSEQSEQIIQTETTQKQKDVDTNISCTDTSPPEVKACPKQTACPSVPAKCTPDYSDAATRLTKNLMTSAKKVTTDQGLDDQYYHQLLIAVYKRFYTLNKTLLQEEQESVKPSVLNKDKVLSLKFLEKLKKEIIQYEEEETATPKPIGQAGGTYNISNKDIKTVLNSNEDSICTVYSCLKGF